MEYLRRDCFIQIIYIKKVQCSIKHKKLAAVSVYKIKKENRKIKIVDKKQIAVDNKDREDYTMTVIG